MKYIAHKVLVVSALRVLAMCVSLGTTVVLARLLGVDEYGRYALVLSLGAILVLPALQGLPLLALREVAASEMGRSGEAVRQMHVFTIAILGGLGSVGFLVIWALISLFPSALGSIDVGLLAASLLICLGGVYCLVLGGMLRGRGHDIRGHIAELVVRPIAFLGFLCAIWLTIDEPAASAAVVGNLFAVTLGALVAASLLSPGLARSVPQWRAWASALLPLSGAAGAQLVSAEISVVALGLFRTESEAGIYRVASTVALQTSFLLTVVNAVAAPRFAAMYRLGDIEGLRRLNKLAGLSATIFGLLVCLVFVGFGEVAIDFALGEGYRDALTPLVVLSLTHAFTLFAGSTNVLLSMTGQEKVVLRAALVSLAVGVSLNLALVPSFGVPGAVVSAATALVVWRLSLWRGVRRLTVG